MKLSQLRDVLAVAEAGSLRAASRHLGVAQPVMTRNIRDIENELGVALFERHARGVRLTEIGEALVRRASRIQEEVRRAREEVEQLKGRATGQVSVTASTAASIAILPRALHNFRKEYPEAVVKVSEGLFEPVTSDLLEGRIDFYVGVFDQEAFSNQFVMEKLFDNRRVIVARTGHPLANATRLADLVGAQWVRPTMATRTSEADFERMFERAGLPPPHIVMHSRSTLVTLLLVASSDLLTILPKQWLEYPLAAGQFLSLTVDDPLVAAPVCIVRRRDVPLTPMAERLCDLLRRAGTHYAHEGRL
ncbi:LysR family transcriptional regulator [Sphingobium jiangsuense]|uniref:DNA-binding transcriptional LysR family regulator n=1 Tax=Sphingobium jiangsuense TaxID=870476 RepID=A0A7W6BLY7_9SPHN|nr:LysR substrate-binding domain-containing protein [Sphingobium jiangsuense]MBB3928264.1 DNA-binding transcriptional LysR family regulator [Sphingobium jiangsuense]GLS99360.1 LysR family transcriptional regulator [Sphingobium jiangsuense]